MTYVKLVEQLTQIKQQVEVIATVEDSSGDTFLGITDFILLSSELLPEDEDDLCYYLEDKHLVWDVFVPDWENV